MTGNKKGTVNGISRGIGLLVALFIVSQVFIITATFGLFPFSENDTPKAFTGHILFTGDTLGKTDLAGCERMGSITRRIHFLKKFSDCIYLDLGNVTTDSVSFNQHFLPLFFSDYQPLGLEAVNLTRRDLINFDRCGFRDFSPTLVSANLKIETSNLPKEIIRRYKLVPFRLKKGTERITVTAGITGVTDNLKKLHRSGLKFEVADVEQSLNAVRDALDSTDLRILLFHDSYFKLEKLLLEKKIGFDLVIAHSTLPEQVDKMIRVGGTPVVFVEDMGRSVGCIKVIKHKTGFSFQYDAYKLGMGAPEDGQGKKLMEKVKSRMTQIQSSHTHEPENETDNEVEDER